MVAEHYVKRGIKPLKKIMVELALDLFTRKLIVTLKVVQVGLIDCLYNRAVRRSKNLEGGGQVVLWLYRVSHSEMSETKWL